MNILKCHSLFLVPLLQPAIVFKQLKIEGFIVSRWGDSWMSGIQRNLNLIKEVSIALLINCVNSYFPRLLFIFVVLFFKGKLIHPEHVVQGFENLPQAFIGLLNGDNIGKVVIKV